MIINLHTLIHLFLQQNNKDKLMNKTTRRNIRKSNQLRHTKEKLYEMKNEASHKKDNLVKTLKNLLKRQKRKGL